VREPMSARFASSDSSCAAAFLEPEPLTRHSWSHLIRSAPISKTVRFRIPSYYPSIWRVSVTENHSIGGDIRRLIAAAFLVNSWAAMHRPARSGGGSWMEGTGSTTADSSGNAATER